MTAPKLIPKNLTAIILYAQRSSSTKRLLDGFALRVFELLNPQTYQWIQKSRPGLRTEVHLISSWTARGFYNKAAEEAKQALEREFQDCVLVSQSQLIGHDELGRMRVALCSFIRAKNPAVIVLEDSLDSLLQ